MNRQSEISGLTLKGDRLPPLPSLTGLRFIVSLIVFLFHVSVVNSPIPPYRVVNPFSNGVIAQWFSFVFAQLGYMGVSFFFVLTGFIIAWSAFPFKESKLSFWRRRAAKIYPNHIVVSLIALGLFSWSYTSISTMTANLLLIHAFFPAPDTYVSVNPPAWSLCVDIAFYLIFPFLITRVLPLRRRGLWIFSAFVVLVIVAIPFVNDHYISSYPKSPITPISAHQFWFGYIFPPTRIFDFILGALLARIVMLGAWPRFRILDSLGLVVAGAIVAKFVPFIYSLDAVTIVPVAALICSIASADLNKRNFSWLATGTMQKLGEVSFGFYICQGITIFYLRTLIRGSFGISGAIALIAAGFCLSLLAGWALYVGVERPALRRWGRSRRTHESDLQQKVVL
ncbi:acyltransferase family protein [Paraburkholderia sp. BCC1885]|uniref:acyltransferase family protein n=1 Tax=Paraburkholderia sp. BCC1885 TaxID=2562669 RepID=UPI001183E1AF|nr:acyltransferase [Paraburkholderia sp. BCC1885]